MKRGTKMNKYTDGVTVKEKENNEKEEKGRKIKGQNMNEKKKMKEVE